MKNRWTVVTENIGENAIGTPIKSRHYLYGFGDDLSECFTEEKMKNIEIIPYEKWTSNDFAEILGNEYENANYHRFVNIPNIILRAVREQNLGWEIENCLMKRICEALYDEI